MTNIDWFLEIIEKRGLIFDLEKLRKRMETSKSSEKAQLQRMIDEFGIVYVEDGVELLEVHPVITRTVSGRIQFSEPNVTSFSKETRDCLVHKAVGKGKLTHKRIKMDIVSEEPNIIMHILGRKDITGDIYTQIAQAIEPFVLAMVVETWEKDSCVYAKQVANNLRFLLDKNTNCSFLKLDGATANGEGRKLDYELDMNGKSYKIIGWQRLVAGSEEALLRAENPACILLEDLETGENSLVNFPVEFLRIPDKGNDTTYYYRGNILFDKLGAKLRISSDVAEIIRKDIKISLISYCYGARRETISEAMEYLDVDTVLTIYEQLRVKDGLKSYVTKHTLKIDKEAGTKHFKVGGEEVVIPYSRGDSYNKFAPILMQHLGVCILDEFLGLVREAYIEGWFDILLTEHDEIIGEIDVDRLYYCHPLAEEMKIESFLGEYFSIVGEKTLGYRLNLHSKIYDYGM